jgi:hypothetical protein
VVKASESSGTVSFLANQYAIQLYASRPRSISRTLRSSPMLRCGMGSAASPQKPFKRESCAFRKDCCGRSTGPEGGATGAYGKVLRA